MITKTLQENSSMKSTRFLTLSIMAVITVFMLGLAYTANAAMLYRQLDSGMSGSDVSDLQTYLGSDSAIYPSGLVTGYFGQLTKGGVEKFQTAQGIVNSGTPATTGYGRVGPTTMSAINARMSGTVSSGFDVVAPTISSLNIVSSSNSSTFNWNTSENAAAIIYYSPSYISMIEGNATNGVTISGSSLLVHSDLRSAHTGIIAGLSANTTYYYVVYVRDGSGNETITLPSTFVTANN